MFRQCLLTVVIFLSGFGVLYAQGKTERGVVLWEYLALTPVQTDYSSNNIGARVFRDYNYLTSEEFFRGPALLGWLKDSGWEMTGAVSSEQSNLTYLYFKRPYKAVRTKNEVEKLKKAKEVSTAVASKPAPPPILIDLDRADESQKTDERDRADETRLRSGLGKVKDLPVTVVSVTGQGTSPTVPHVAAEIVLDATGALLKNGNEYRASEVEKYGKDAANLIADTARIKMGNTVVEGRARAISYKSFAPVKIGTPFVPYDDIGIRISVVLNGKGGQIIVWQGWISGKWLPNQ
jgi:hypothetical protein